MMSILPLDQLAQLLLSTLLGSQIQQIELSTEWQPTCSISYAYDELEKIREATTYVHGIATNSMQTSAQTVHFGHISAGSRLQIDPMLVQFCCPKR
jgi:hypothetical protein